MARYEVEQNEKLKIPNFVIFSVTGVLSLIHCIAHASCFCSVHIKAYDSSSSSVQRCMFSTSVAHVKNTKVENYLNNSVTPILYFGRTFPHIPAR